MRSLPVVCLFLCAWAALAQSDRGTITGTISDQADAMVANAAIEAKNAETGAQYQTISTATGNYTIPQLPVGTYQVSVALPGFKKFVQSGIRVETAQVVRVDAMLQVGSATDSVTVMADASMLKTETIDISHNVTVQTLNEIPMLGVGSAAAGSSGIRNPNNVVQLVPGAYFVPNSQVKINGAPTNTQAYHVEGMDATNLGFPYAAAQVQPSVDAIQEVSVQTSNFAPEFGTSGGGFFNVTMRSGTNGLHGSAYDYFVNEVLNAGTPFTNDGHGNLVRPRARRNDYGFTLGGPVRIPKLYNGHDRTFFFFNFEQYRETIRVNNIPITVPTDSYRRGDFSQAAAALGNHSLGTDDDGRSIIQNTIYDPGTLHMSGKGNPITNPFPNNAIPESLLDPVALKIQSYIPQPNLPGLTNNYLPSYPAIRHTTIPAVKIDHALSDQARLSFYWSFTHTDSPYSNIYGQSEGLPDIITATRGTFIHSHVERLNFDDSLSPTVLLHLGAGYQQNNFFDDAPLLNFNAAQTFGLKGATLNRNVPVFNGFCPPGVGVGAAATCTAAGGMVNMGPSAGQTHSYWEKPAANASVTWVNGSHTYKLGGEVFFEGVPNFPYTSTNGTYTFSANETGIPYLTTSSGQNLSGGVVGFPYASFLLGAVDQYAIAAPSETRNGKSQWGLFLQDSWKVTRNLTLDYGLRWDYGTYFKEQYGRAMDFSPTTPNPSAGGHAGAWVFEGGGPGHCNCSFASNYPYAIGPRVGAAYQITPRTVLRGGWGLIYSQTGTTSLGIANAGTAATNTVLSTGQGLPSMYLKSGIPAQTIPTWPVISAGVFPAAGSTITPSLPGGVGLLDPNAGRPARQSQWSIGIQREITRDLVLEASYVGNRGVWWQAPGLINLNAITPQILAVHNIDLNQPADRSLLTSLVTSTAAVSRGIALPYAGFPTNQTVAQALRPFPQFGSIPAAGPPLGKTWYDALQAKATKRLSHGLNLTSTLTWQKSLQEGVDTNTTVNNILMNPALSKSLSSFDQPLLFSVAASYSLPRLPGNKVLSYAVKDWQIGTLLQYGSGLPIPTPAAANSSTLNNQIFQNTLANRVSGVPLYTVPDINCHCYDPAKTFVLNQAAWTSPPAGTFGTSAEFYSDFRYQRHPQENLNLGRTFRLKERMSLNLRVEFNNIFNRTFLNNPSNAGYATPQSRNPTTGLNSGGFGYINLAVASNQAGQPRNGTIVARLTF